MLKNYLQTALRNVLKRRAYAFISIAGLALGITAFLLIEIYVWTENSYDEFHVNKSRIFRIQEDSYSHGVLEDRMAGVGAAVGPDLKDAFPEVRRFVRFRKTPVVLSSGDIVFRESKVFFASEDFFRVFSLPLLKGVDSLVLTRPFTMVVSESFGKKYFGSVDPIGKILTNNGSDHYEITGVFKDVPENTHLQVDALFSFNSLYTTYGAANIKYLTEWGWVGYPTYIELAPGADAEQFAGKLPKFIDQKLGDVLRALDGNIVFNLQPITSIHLESNLSHEISPNGDGRSVRFLGLIGVLILIMAWINYVSLATARSMERAKEVGVRKVLGGNRLQVITQFLLESMMFNIVALATSVVAVAITLPWYSTLVNRQFNLDFFNDSNIHLTLFIVFLVGVIGSGLYPAFVMSGFRIDKVLKGKFKTSPGGNYLRKGLVITQFVTSIVLIAGTYIVITQIKFMKDIPLGVDIEQMLVVNSPTITDSLQSQRFDQFRNELLSYPGVTMVTKSSSVPGREPVNGAGGVRLTTQEPKDASSFDVMYVDHQFMNTYGLQLMTGRTFSKEYHDQDRSVLLNESALQLLQVEDAGDVIGERILVYGDTLTVVGVMRDYHQQSVKTDVNPLIFICDDQSAFYYSIKISSSSPIKDVVSSIEGAFKKSFAGNPFNYFFLDDYYNEQYKSEQQFSTVFSLFTSIAILIACLGLFGLSSYSVIHRAKEIGIRKILGASVDQITLLVSREYIVLVLIANIIACPLFYLVMSNWLNGFANRISIGFLAFVTPGLIALLVAILTVAFQSVKAASANPTESLRSE